MRRFLPGTLCLILSVLCFQGVGTAQIPINPAVWSGSGASTGTATDTSSFTGFPATTAPGATRVWVSCWRRSATMQATTGGACYNSNNWSLGTTLASAQAGGRYISFTVSNDNTTELEIMRIVLHSQISATGPTSVQMMYDMGAGDVSFANPLTGLSTGGAIDLRFTPPAATGPFHLCPGQTVTFKLYGWNATTAAGTLRINDNDTLAASYVDRFTVTASAAPNTVCVGANVALNGTRALGAPGGHTYAWTGPTTPSFATSLTAAIFGAALADGGVYTLTGTDSWGCTATDTTTVTVLAVPTTPTVTPTGPVSICSFDSVLLTASSGTVFQWDTLPAAGPSGAIPGATNSTYMVRRAGRYRVVVRNAVGGCTASSNRVTINVLASAPATVTASGSLTFCTGGSVTLTAASGYTYQWYDGATAIAGATNAAYTATTSGVLSVRITATSGCVTTSAAYTVTEVSLPNISTADSTTFCQGGSAVLRVNITSAATGILYQWKKNTLNIPGATTNTYIANTTGTYTCYVNIPGSCTITTNAISLLVHPLPAPAITYNGATNKLSTYTYYVRYQWMLNTTIISGATTYRTTPFYNGGYRVMVTDTNGCTKISGEYGMYNLAVGNLSSAADVQIYPNPANDILHIESPAQLNSVISSVEGRVVMSNGSSKDIDISHLPNGLYIITVFDTEGNRLLVEKLVKE